MSEAADIPVPVDNPPNARPPAQVINLDDEEFNTDGLLVRAQGSVLMGNPTAFDRAG